MFGYWLTNSSQGCHSNILLLVLRWCYRLVWLHGLSRLHTVHTYPVIGHVLTCFKNEVIPFSRINGKWFEIFRFDVIAICSNNFNECPSIETRNGKIAPAICIPCLVRQSKFSTVFLSSFLKQKYLGQTRILKTNHYVESVQIRSYFLSVFFWIQT